MRPGIQVLERRTKIAPNGRTKRKPVVINMAWIRSVIWALVRGKSSLLPLPVVPLVLRVNCITPISSCWTKELPGFDGVEGAVWEYAQMMFCDPAELGISKVKLV